MEDELYYKRLSRNCYYVFIGIVVVFCISLLYFKIMDTSWMELYPYPCTLYDVAKLYCPGCGGTRAVKYLLQGNIIKSFIYHPVVPYAAGYMLVYMVSHTLNIITKGKVKAMLFKPIYYYVMIGIILLQCIIKNILVIMCGIHII